MVNENDAPHGYKAVEYTKGCRGCAFDDGDCARTYCYGSNRADETGVIFIRREEIEHAPPVVEENAVHDEPDAPRSKYHRNVKGVEIDVYDVLTAFGVTNPATAHAIKKLLMPGNRGHKDTITDLREAMLSIVRAIELEQ